MEKSNPNLFENIRQKLFGDATLLVSVRLSIAKTIFILLAFLYFFSYLLVIGGFHTEIFNVVVFYLYPLFAFSTIALIYNIIRYAVVIYVEKISGILTIVIILLTLVYLWLIATHVGMTITSIQPYIEKITSLF